MVVSEIVQASHLNQVYEHDIESNVLQWPSQNTFGMWQNESFAAGIALMLREVSKLSWNLCQEVVRLF